MTTNAKPIEPALSAEEWKQLARNRNFMAGECEHYAFGNDFEGAMAVANAALPDDSPYKITWADFDALNGRNPEAQIIADKIRALLPPR